jgi:hypothetical protein
VQVFINELADVSLSIEDLAAHLNPRQWVSGRTTPDGQSVFGDAENMSHFGWCHQTILERMVGHALTSVVLG